MKKSLIIVGSVAGALALAMVILFIATSGAVETAESFFRSAASGDMKGAKEHLAEGFKAVTSDPPLSAQDIIGAEGYYPTEPSRAHFTYTFVHDKTAWNLLGIDFDVRPIGQ